jgi:hypothetical protein
LVRNARPVRAGHFPASAAHSHSIVNKPFFSFNIQWLIFLLIGNTMKNTMLSKSFKMLKKTAD